MKIGSIRTAALSPTDASIQVRKVLTRMKFNKPTKMAFGAAKSGEAVMLVSDPESWNMPDSESTPTLLRQSTRDIKMRGLRRAVSFRSYGNLRYVRAAPRLLRPGDYWAPIIAAPQALIGVQARVAAENYLIQLAIAEGLPFLLHRIGGFLLPARTIPMHDIHERARINSYPKTSQIPGRLRVAGTVQLSIERLPATSQKIMFGQAAHYLMSGSANVDRNALPSCPVLQAFSTARPIFRCEMLASEDMIPALDTDTCIAWQSADGTSEVERAYTGTEIEAFDSFFSEEELQALLAAFFVPGSETRN